MLKALVGPHTVSWDAARCLGGKLKRYLMPDAGVHAREAYTIKPVKQKEISAD